MNNASCRHYLPLGLLLLLSLVLFPLLSRDFGITWDEPIQNEYGALVYEYFRSGFSDLRATTYANSYYYGCLFDLLCAAAQHLAPAVDPFDLRHILNSLFGWLVLLCAGLIAQRRFGALAGLFAVLFLCFTPRFFADCMNNPKDLPFALFGLAALAPLLSSKKEHPYFSRGAVLLFVGATALAINVRVGGLLFLGYGGLALGARALADHRQLTLRRVSALLAVFFVCCLAALLLGTLFWPWAHANPLLRSFEALDYMTHFRPDWVQGGLLFGGEYLPLNKAPWDYMPRWILITTPVAILLGAPFAFLGLRAPERRAALGMLAFAVLFPIAYIVITRPVVYDGARHLLFVIPPLALLAAAGWSELFARARRPLALAALALAFCCAWYDPVRFSFVNHPNQTVYFNQLVGGVPGAFLRYDLDYWNNSFKQAIDWLNVEAKASKTRISFSSFNGNLDAPGLYARRYPALRYISRKRPESREAMFALALMRGEPDFMREALQREGAAHAVLVDGTPICLVFRMESGEE